jgi:hypothetical protein
VLAASAASEAARPLSSSLVCSTGAAAAADAADGDAPAPTATSALERLRVVEVAVARWNPNKGRLEAQVMGV